MSSLAFSSGACARRDFFADIVGRSTIDILPRDGWVGERSGQRLVRSVLQYSSNLSVDVPDLLLRRHHAVREEKAPVGVDRILLLPPREELAGYVAGVVVLGVTLAPEG